MSQDRRRLDVLLVEQGLVRSRSRAQGVIMAGLVYVDGERVEKAGTRVPTTARLEIRGEGPRYVSRGGLKLAHALQAFDLDVSGSRCLDVGASTGGFTDCLLQHGARHVTALDVGHGQLAWALRQDERVTVLEGINARYLQPDQVNGPFDIITVDVAFISVTKVLPALLPLLKPGASMVILIKPQFEARPDNVGRGGVVRDVKVHRRVLREVLQAVASLTLSAVGLIPSPIKGHAGNVEFLLHACLAARETENEGDAERLLATAFASQNSESR